MNAPNKFAICIFADEEMLLTPRRIYQVLPDEKAERSDYIRIVDDEGEDYLYPKRYFVFVPLSTEIEKSYFKRFNAAKFLQTFKRTLENPILMLM